MTDAYTLPAGTRVHVDVATVADPTVRIYQKDLHVVSAMVPLGWLEFAGRSEPTAS